VRVPEKTIELNLCSQLTALFGGGLLWFGLTQDQEAKAGFDACARTGATMLILQFKASNNIVGGARRFFAPHVQMQALRDHVRSDRRIYYALPTVGTTRDIQQNPDLLAQTWLLDVSLLPATIPAPTTKSGTVRKSGLHYVDMVPPTVTIHSEPFDVKLTSAADIDVDIPPASRPAHPGEINIREYQVLRQVLRRKAVGAIVR
jgi:hypothetical protein